MRLVIEIYPYTMTAESAERILTDRLNALRPPGEAWASLSETHLRDWAGRIIGKARIEGAGPWPEVAENDSLGRPIRRVDGGPIFRNGERLGDGSHVPMPGDPGDHE